MEVGAGFRLRARLWRTAIALAAEVSRPARSRMMPPVDPVILVVFLVVYVGMMLGELPGLRLDRAGIALLGAIALVAAGRVSPAGGLASRDLAPALRP